MRSLLLREYRARRDRLAAGAFAAGFSALIVAGLPSSLLLLGERSPANGLLGTGLSFALYGVLQALILGRYYIRSLRDAEARVKDLETRSYEVNQLNDELRHQVAERSRELTAALVRSEGYLAPAAVAEGTSSTVAMPLAGRWGRGEWARSTRLSGRATDGGWR